MRNGLCLGLLLLSACGSVRVFDMPKVQQNLQSTTQKSDAVAQKAEADFAEKKMLIENLAQSNAVAFKQNENEIRQRLRAMDEALQDIIVEKKKMAEANGDIASLSYNRDSVRSDEKEYPRVDEAVQRFEHAAAELNAAVVDYSRESNTMADLIANKKLYYYFDVADFQKRVQRNVVVAQDNLKVMERELKRSQAVLNNSQSDAKSKQEQIFKDMHQSADEYAARANRFSEINREVNLVVLGAAKISSLDPHWPEVQKLVAEFDRIVQELGVINDRFLTRAEAFRNPHRRLR